jgi:hypothetical protein
MGAKILPPNNNSNVEILEKKDTENKTVTREVTVEIYLW